MPLPALLPLGLALLAAPAMLLVSAGRPRLAAPTALAAAGATFAAALWGWGAGGGTVWVNWAPTWGWQLRFALDGLAAVYLLLASGVGALVLAYAGRYMQAHLAHQERPASDGLSFYAFMLLFLGSMAGLVMAQDLVLMFVFWDVTAIASYFLIGFDRHSAEARRAALMALLVTGITSVLFLAGALLIFNAYQTFSLPALIEQAESGRLLTGALALIMTAALAKSAQVPLHFWLPRAMAAPTPVSAYLHSAAMVAAGVFLLARLYPLLRTSQALLDALLVVGGLSIAVGGVLALTQDVLKRVLAYSTISQYGYVALLLGLGGPHGAAGAAFYVLAHGLAKAALFLTAGAVTEATGKKRLSEVGGLARRMPVLAASAAVAAASLAGLPLTMGFFKDEALFITALERGPGYAALATGAAALTLAYAWRFWQGVFGGRPQAEAHAPGWQLVLPIAILAGVSAAGGLVVEPFAALAAQAGSVTFGESVRLDLGYHFDARPENLMALGAYAGGAAIAASRGWWQGAAAGAARLGRSLGPEHWYRAGLAALNRLSSASYRREERGLEYLFVTILVPGAILVAVGLAAQPTEDTFRVGGFSLSALPLLLALGVTVVAALSTTLARRHLTQVLALGSTGYALSVIYALYGAPDVALVAILVGTLSTLFFLGVLALVPKDRLREMAAQPEAGARLGRDRMVGLIAGAFAFAVVWAALSQPAATEGVGAQYTALAEAAHGADVVTVILADFRGLDTLGEITVITVALLGIRVLLARRSA